MRTTPMELFLDWAHAAVSRLGYQPIAWYREQKGGHGKVDVADQPSFTLIVSAVEPPEFYVKKKNKVDSLVLEEAPFFGPRPLRYLAVLGDGGVYRGTPKLDPNTNNFEMHVEPWSFEDAVRFCQWQKATPMSAFFRAREPGETEKTP